MLLVERENTLPIVLHADHNPTVLVCSSHQRFGESPDVRIRTTAGWPIGVLAVSVIVMHQHHQSSAVTRLRPFQHLLIAGGIAEGRVGPLADEHVDADGFSRAIVNEERFWFTHQYGFAA